MFRLNSELLKGTNWAESSSNDWDSQRKRKKKRKRKRNTNKHTHQYHNITISLGICAIWKFRRLQVCIQKWRKKEPAGNIQRSKLNKFSLDWRSVSVRCCSSECDRCMLDAWNNKLVFICKVSINTVRINTLVWFGLVWFVAIFARCSYLINGKVHEINWNCLFFFFCILCRCRCRCCCPCWCFAALAILYMYEAVALYLSGCLNPLWKCGRLPLYLVIRCLILLEFRQSETFNFLRIVFMRSRAFFFFLLLLYCLDVSILSPIRFVSHASHSMVEWLQSLWRKHMSGSRHNPHGRK